MTRKPQTSVSSRRHLPPAFTMRSVPTILCLVAVFLLSAAAVSAEPGSEVPEHLLAPTQVEAIDSEQFAAVLAAHKGKVVLVNLWATWCIPCVQELPEIDLLQTRYRDRGLVVLAVSFDKLEKLDPDVREFFAEKAPNLISYLQTEEDEYDFVSVLDPEWIGGLPTSFFIDREGEVADHFIGRLTYQDMERRTLRLLGDD